MKKQLLIAVLSLLTLGAFAEASKAPEGEMPLPPKMQQKGKRMERCIDNPEFKAQREMEKKLIEAYKQDPSDANKTALKAFCTKQFEKGQKMAEKRLAEMKKHIAEIEKRTEEAKANKDKMIDEHMERLLNPPKKGDKMKKGERGKDCRKADNPCPKAPESGCPNSKLPPPQKANDAK